MKHAWKVFWEALAAIFNTVGYVAQAGEEYAKGLHEDAKFTSQKDSLKREAKIKAWRAKIEQADA